MKNHFNFKAIRNFLTSFALLAMITFNGIAAEKKMDPPEDVVKNTVDQMVDNIQTNRALYKEDTSALYQMVEDTLIPAVHVPRMANLILGKHRKKSSPEQKTEFAQQFKTFLMRSYATALLDYTGDERVNYLPTEKKPGADKVTIKAELLSSDGQSYPIKLYMSNRGDDSWRAYNLEVAGINIVSTYRANFSEIIARKGVDGLIKELREKNEKLAS